MKTNLSIFNKVNTERLYQHVLNLEGERHPLNSPQKLRQAADYIYAELESYGVSIRLQEFPVAGFPDTFLNVEGWVGDSDAPCTVIMSHYDTFLNTTGANDNAAAVAVMLECARILAQEDDVPPVRFLSFSLEEGNPAIESRIQKNAQKLGLMDEEGRYTSYQVSKLMEKHRGLIFAAWQKNPGKPVADTIASATAQLGDKLPGNMSSHLKAIEIAFDGVTARPGQANHLGAWAWVDEALKLGKQVKFGICLDEIGRVCLEEGSQVLPGELNWDMLQTYKVDTERMIGDWAFLITNNAADKLGQVFCEHCEQESVNLPYGYLHIPMNYEQIRQEMPQAIGSDYSAFWNAGIPALFLFDSAGWRKPYHGHTMSDTIDRLDFDQIAKICKATLATLIDPTL